MANVGNSFIVTLEENHLNWGIKRYTNSRPTILGETYIPIPSQSSKAFNIFNSNKLGKGNDELGINLFEARSSDGIYQGIVKSQGANKAGSPYAKQFSEVGNLKGFNHWFSSTNVQPGTKIKVEWTSPTEIIFTIL